MDPSPRERLQPERSIFCQLLLMKSGQMANSQASFSPGVTGKTVKTHQSAENR